MPPILLIRTAVALVWLYEGLWCKLLRPMPHQEGIVDSVPFLPPFIARLALPAVGVLEVLIGLWILSGFQPWAAFVTQAVLLVGMNGIGLVTARQLIHDPTGTVLKNFALLVLAWVAGAHPAA